MLNLLIMTMMIVSFFIFMNMKHPLAMGLNILIQSMLISLFTGLQLFNFWFSYILFLVFLGGLMVLFIYVTSLASNELFSINFYNIFIFVMIFMFTIIISLFLDYWYMPPLSLLNFSDFMEISYISLMIFKIYSFPMSILTFFLIIYLLLTLIAVVNITKFLSGPLRIYN